MTKSSSELRSAAEAGGYIGDDFVRDCLDTVADLEGKLAAMEGKGSSPAPATWPLWAIAGVIVLALVPIGFQASRISKDAEKMATLQAANNALQSTNAEYQVGLRELRGSLDRLQAVSKENAAAADANKEAIGIYMRNLDRVLATAADLARASAGQNKAPETQEKPPETKK